MIYCPVCEPKKANDREYRHTLMCVFCTERREALQADYHQAVPIVIESGLVFRFQKPHKVGTICGFPCSQCGGDDAIALDASGKRLPRVPFFIAGEATEDDWRKSVIANGGVGHHEPGRHYYFVTVD
jgi:hypothetical protein